LALEARSHSEEKLVDICDKYKLSFAIKSKAETLQEEDGLDGSSSESESSEENSQSEHSDTSSQLSGSTMFLHQSVCVHAKPTLQISYTMKNGHALEASFVEVESMWRKAMMFQ
jgi:hypothetical protein